MKRFAMLGAALGIVQFVTFLLLLRVAGAAISTVVEVMCAALRVVGVGG